LSKAFDKVNLQALFIKLMQENIPVQLLRLLEDMICVCFSCVKWGEIRPTFFSVMYGVRQGSVLAPFCSQFVLMTLAKFARQIAVDVPNFVRFDAGMLKLQQMIKWDVFLEHGVYVCIHIEFVA